MKHCIKENFSHEIVINKSTFICHMFKVNNVVEAQLQIKEINELYNDATHNCYCYVIGALTKVSDDGEPNGTAGLPMLNVITHHNLDNILCIVTRYFGGIKLGAGGLTRAYSNSVSEALLTTELLTLVSGLKVNITFDIKHTGSIDYLFNSCNIKVSNKEFLKFVTYTFEIETTEFESFKKRLENIDYAMKIETIEDITIGK